MYFCNRLSDKKVVPFDFKHFTLTVDLLCLNVSKKVMFKYF